MATDGDDMSVFGNQAVSSNPLIEISLMVPSLAPSSIDVSEWTVPATFWGPMTLARTGAALAEGLK